MKNEKKMDWTTLESEYLIRRPWLTARRDKVALPDGRVHDEYYVLEYPDWVNVIAITAEGDYIIEQQWRQGLGRVSTEICAGVVEAGEEPLEAARRELSEETGYEGGEWEKLMVVAPNPGMMNNLCHCFVARGVRKVTSQHLDATEDIRVFLCPRDEVFRRLQRGEFLQAMMAAPLWRHFSEVEKRSER